jgi:ribonuclease VapC
MVVVDSSALVAILMQEDDANDLSHAIFTAEKAIMSAVTRLECTIVMVNKMGLGGDEVAEAAILALGIEIVDFDANQATAARNAHLNYGRGQKHPAKLNFGDCMAYALAKSRNLPLLFKGNDFSQTDILSALPT